MKVMISRKNCSREQWLCNMVRQISLLELTYLDFTQYYPEKKENVNGAANL
jgi:hypothetical protein